MDVLVLLFIFSCGVSCGILLGRRDERRKAAVAAAAVPPVVRPVAPVVAPTSRPVVEPPPAPVVAPPPSPPGLEPAVAAALGDRDPLATVLLPVALPNKKAKKAGLDPAAFTMRDDILERLRRAEEVGVEPEVGRDLLADTPRPRAPSLERDHELAERERRVLERLAQQAPPPDDGG